MGLLSSDATLVVLEGDLLFNNTSCWRVLTMLDHGFVDMAYVSKGKVALVIWCYPGRFRRWPSATFFLMSLPVRVLCCRLIETLVDGLNSCHLIETLVI